MTMWPELYPSGHEDFSLPGTPLLDAFEVAVNERINAAGTISFNMPQNSRMLSSVKQGAVVRALGQLYIIGVATDGVNNGQPYVRVQGKHIFWEICEKRHLPKAFWIGVTARAILQSAFSGIAYGSTAFRMLTAAELATKGMQEVSERTDIDRDKINPLEVASRVRDHLGGEMFVDNFAFALVRRVGQKTRQVFTLNMQMSSVERVQENTQLVTRLYPYGQNSMEISAANGGIPFIDSPHINKYPVIYEGHIDFPDFTRPAELLQRALREFAPNNYWRIDKPRVNYRISTADLWKLAESQDKDKDRLSLGDEVYIYDQVLGFDSQVRVVARESYPYEPRSSVITLGDPPRTVADVLADADEPRSLFTNPFIKHLPPQVNIPNLDDIIAGLPPIAGVGGIPVRRFF